MKPFTGFILILLGLLFKVASTVNTTKTYNVELEIEAAAFTKFKELLGNITVVNDDKFTASVTNISITTDCQIHGESMNCTCRNGNSWSDEFLKEYPDCFSKTNCLIKHPNYMQTCLSEKRVLINGSFTISNPRPELIYLDPKTEIYKNLLANLTLVLESVYSSLNWFDWLKVTDLRHGSIIGDFIIQLSNPFDVGTLEDLTIEAQIKINATFNLVTTGVIKISPQELIGSNEVVKITCEPPKDLGNVKWFLQRSGKQKQVTNGSESTVYQFPLNSTVSINKTSEAWKGTFICDYASKKLSSIIHRASVDLDVALFPEIFITGEPQFPNCKYNPTVAITIKCYINNSTEKYTISWTGAHGNTDPISNPSSMNKIYYEARKLITCNENKETEMVSCAFTNRKNQTTNEHLQIPVITNNSIVCRETDGWPEAKASFTAKQLCESSDVGLKERMCSVKGQYEQIVSKCVNRELQVLLMEAKDLQRGIGHVQENAVGVFSNLKQSTETTVTTEFYNIKVTVDIMDTMQEASKIQQSKWNESVLPDFVKTSSNLLNSSLLDTWQLHVNQEYPNNSLAVKYLNTIEEVLSQTHVNSTNLDFYQENVHTTICNKFQPCNNAFNVSITEISSHTVFQTSIKNLDILLPKTSNGIEMVLNGIILSVVPLDTNTTSSISMQFQNKRLPNHQMHCVFFDVNKKQWSGHGCKWGGPKNPNICNCNHLTPFTILMSKMPIKLPYMDELTYIGLGFSVCSLALCLVIEFAVWNTVVKSNISHFRHTILVNTVLCLFIAHSSLLADNIITSAKQWCLVRTVLKHFCFLAAFFWMLCLSVGLLHQVVLVFVHLRKKVYLGLCFSIGYICPLIIVSFTVITYDSGASDSYYVESTCWLKYERLLHGSIHAFVLPVGVIVFVNMFTIVLVISKILKPAMSEGRTRDDKDTVRSIIKTVIVLTPTLGITWFFGFFVLMLDLTMTPWAEVVNYAFTFFNSFQGFFILLTGCFGEKKVRDALLMRLRPRNSKNVLNERTDSMAAAPKKKFMKMESLFPIWFIYLGGLEVIYFSI